jgi:L-seryl-tRNA(Ser) seleniumtransferase
MKEKPMEPRRAALLRQLPKVDDLLRHPALAEAVSHLPRPLATAVVRQVLAAARDALTAGDAAQLPPSLDEDALLAELHQALKAAALPSLRRVVNATGVIIHTNLGRSCLAHEAIAQVLEAAARYSTLEYDLAQGQRGSRQSHLEGLLKELTGAPAALVVNNNAAAVLLTLTALAQGREVIIARGQLVEIGGSFRLPDIMAASGAILKEVGATNKTYRQDYERAITDRTAMLLKVHPSNFRILGFTYETPLADLVALGREYGLWVVEDLGSGCLVDLSRYGLEREPTVQETLKAGADLVLFSGDKLLGGPQAGVILGAPEAVQTLKQHPMTRAVRPDKLTLAALEATLRLYLEEPRAVAAIPTLRLAARPQEELNRQARTLARKLKRLAGDRLKVEVVSTDNRVGGGALPQTPLPGAALAVSVLGLSPPQLEARLRANQPPIIARVEHDTVLLEMRTLLPGDDMAVLTAMGGIVQS